jgi:hypothetical protein
MILYNIIYSKISKSLQKYLWLSAKPKFRRKKTTTKPSHHRWFPGHRTLVHPELRRQTLHEENVQPIVLETTQLHRPEVAPQKPRTVRPPRVVGKP